MGRDGAEMSRVEIKNKKYPQSPRGWIPVEAFGKPWEGPITCKSGAGLGHPGLSKGLEVEFVPFATGCKSDKHPWDPSATVDQ